MWRNPYFTIRNWGPESLKPRSSGIRGHAFHSHLTLLGLTKSRSFGFVLSKILGCVNNLLCDFESEFTGSTKGFYWMNKDDYHPVTRFLSPILAEPEAQWYPTRLRITSGVFGSLVRHFLYTMRKLQYFAIEISASFFPHNKTLL